MPKTRIPSAKTDRTGVLAVGAKVVGDLDWIFREQPTDDYGIDAQIEIVEAGTVTGRLIATQIKSGASYFKSPAPGGWWFYLDSDDVDYWLDHSLPVIIVLYDPDISVAYWEVVTPGKLMSTSGSGKKILIPGGQVLGSSSRRKLEKLAGGKPYELRLRQLRLALPWLNLLQSGRRILLEADEWVNKMSGRGELAVVSVDEDGADRRQLGDWQLIAGLRPYSEVLPALVPWADVVLHEETYDEADHDAWEAESLHEDGEGDQYWSESFEDWRMQFKNAGLRPYANSSDEVDHWRLELILNALGKAFLLVDAFAGDDGGILTP